MEGVQQGPKGRKQRWGFGRGDSEPPPRQLADLWERCKLPQLGSGQSPGRPKVFLYFKCSGWHFLLHSIGVSVLISYMQCNVEKALLGFWKPCGSIATMTVGLHCTNLVQCRPILSWLLYFHMASKHLKVQAVANAQTTHHSYTSDRQKLWLPLGVLAPHNLSFSTPLHEYIYGVKD